MTNHEATKAIGATATQCPTCGGAPNPANFGGCCAECNIARKARLARTAVVLREHGQENTEMGRALTHLGY